MYLSASLCSILPPPKHSQSSPTLVICKSGLRIYQKEEIHLFLSPVIDISMIFSKIISPHEILLFPCVFAIVPVKRKYYFAEAALTSWAHWESFIRIWTWFLLLILLLSQETCKAWSGHTWTPQCQSPPQALPENLPHSSARKISRFRKSTSFLSEPPLQPGTNVKHCPTPFKPKLYSNYLNREGHENKIQLSCLCVFHIISPVINETVK